MVQLYLNIGLKLHVCNYYRAARVAFWFELLLYLQGLGDTSAPPHVPALPPHCGTPPRCQPPSPSPSLLWVRDQPDFGHDYSRDLTAWCSSSASSPLLYYNYK